MFFAVCSVVEICRSQSGAVVAISTRGIIGLDPMNVPRVHIQPAGTPEHYEIARVLFLEYQAQLGIDLCFQGFNEELARLPDM